jgi:hypothetical protein
VHSRSKAITNIASECGSAIARNDTFRSTPAMRTNACPKSICASPGRCSRGMNTSLDCFFSARTASFTIVYWPVNPSF